jgi:hypothetical protein
MRGSVRYSPLFFPTVAAALVGLACSSAMGCGTSGKPGFNDGTSTSGTDPSGLAGDGGAGSFGNGTGGGAGGNLNCLGLTSGTKSSAGCDYYVAVPDVISDGAGACFAAFITNTWTDPVSVSVEYAGQTLDATKFAYIPNGQGQSLTYDPLPGGKIPAGQVAILFLNRKAGGFPNPGLNLDCPKGVTPAITATDAASHGTTLGHAFHITTSAAVAAYDIYPFGGGQSAMTSATLLLPTTSWDTNYIAVDALGPGPLNQPWIQIVGEVDGTQVTINPTADIVGGGASIPATKKGSPQTYVVNKGQVLQFTQDAELAGSVIESSAPVGVWGGKTALAIKSCCDETGHQQIPPVRALGSEYTGVRYRNRYDGKEESVPWRLIGAIGGTTLTWEPSAPAGAPTQLAQGQVVQFDASGPFVVKSQDEKHPFYMSAHMTGAAEFDPNMNDGRGDAEFVNVIPPGEFMTSYVFFTDPTYPETNLVLVRNKGTDGAFSDVTLDCAGVLTGWAPVGTSGKYEFARVDLVRHNFAPQGKCNNGRHEIHSKNPFGLTVWGWGSGETGAQFKGFYSQYVSYAYPGGASVQPINDVVVPAHVK